MAHKHLQSLFYAVFDNKHGPTLVHQGCIGGSIPVTPAAPGSSTTPPPPSATATTDPPNASKQQKPRYLTHEEFDKISDYIIAKLELSGSMFTTFVFGREKIVIGYPLFVESDEQRGRVYERNIILFAFGAIVTSDDDLGAFHQLIKKLGNAFRTMEIESCFLSNPQSRMQLDWILPQIVSDIVNTGECFITVSVPGQSGSNATPAPPLTNTIALKLLSKVLDPPDILDQQVPVPTANLDEIISKDTDLTIRHVAKFIDGKRFVKKIAFDARVDVFLVRRCCRQLLYYRCVVMCDIVQYTNTYTCTTKLQVFAKDQKMQKACVEFIMKRGHQPIPPHFAFKLYASIFASQSFGEFCQQFNTRAFGIDDEKFAIFGVANGLLRRVHKYPIVEAVTQSAMDVLEIESDPPMSPPLEHQLPPIIRGPPRVVYPQSDPSAHVASDNDDSGAENGYTSGHSSSRPSALLSPMQKASTSPQRAPFLTAADTLSRMTSVGTTVSYQSAAQSTNKGTSSAASSLIPSLGIATNVASPSEDSTQLLLTPVIGEAGSRPRGITRKLIKLADGSHSMDAICVDLLLPGNEIKDKLERIPKHSVFMVSR